MENKQILSECIIVNSTIKNNVVLGKNRDRNYHPHISIIRELYNDIELVYLFDKITGWKEGMNSYGIGIVNTALLVKRDEGEGKSAKSGKKVKDGNIIYNALKTKTIEQALKIILKGNLYGHTIISDGKKSIRIECTSKVEPYIEEIDISDVNVLTNHGEHYINSGYTEGDDFISSILRQAQVRRNMKGVNKVEDVLKALSISIFDAKNPNHVKRDSKLYTTSQLVMNLTKKEFIFQPVLNKMQKFEGIIDNTPDNYAPKIKIKIVNEKQ